MEQLQSLRVGTGIPELTKPHIVVKPPQGLWHLNLPELWHYRELLYFLVWRDVKVRYKQTVIGATWAILQPLLTMIIFTLLFSYLAKIPSDGLPYPLFVYAALLPWTYFAQAMWRCGNSVVGDAALITKVYFPRLIIPLASVIPPCVDSLWSSLILIGMMAWFGVNFTWALLLLPAFMGMALVTAVAVGLWLSALNVRYRDVNLTVPFLIQIWFFASPVIYPVSLVPETWRLLYNLNPVAGVIEGMRWAILGQPFSELGLLSVSFLMVVGLLIGGIVFFNRMEQTFADEI